MFSYLVLRLMVFIVRHMPRCWGIAFARWLGGMVYRVSPMAEAGRDNFRHVLGSDADPAQVSSLARGAFVNRMWNYYDMLWLSGTKLSHVDWRSRIEGVEYIDQALAEKNGAIVVAAHIGPMEYMIQAVISLGYEFIGIQEHMKNERLHQYLLGLRSSQGLHMISTKDSLLDVYRRIKHGGVLLTAGDRDSTDTGQVVDFFGAPAWLPDGYARLAVRAGVPVLFGYPWRVGEGARGRVFPPIYADPTLAKEEAVRDVVTRTVHLLEVAVRHKPAEWHLSAPVWRLAQRQPEKEAST